MNLYEPQTEIKSPWKDYAFMVLGFWFGLLGILAWWANYIFFTLPNSEAGWTAEQKHKALVELVENAKASGVVEPTAEEKMRALQGSKPVNQENIESEVVSNEL